MIRDLNERSKEIFRHVVDAYIATGEPVGSRTLSRRLGMRLSPATIRNIMADLEEGGLLYAPHTSAGRLPTEAGLKLFVNGLLEVSELNLQEKDKRNIEQLCQKSGKNFSQVLEEAISALSGLSQCAGIVLAPKTEMRLKHIEFVSLSAGQALVVLVTEQGDVENRLIEIPLGMPPSSLVQASNYLNSQIIGCTLTEALEKIRQDLQKRRDELDDLSQKLVEAGLGLWSGDKRSGTLIVKGQANLLADVQEVGELERLRVLFSALETKEGLVDLLDAAINADGVQIFIGSDNDLFRQSGCSLIIAPFATQDHKVIGALGVIGPARINYGRIIPMVDYTAKVINRLLGGDIL